MRIQGKNLLLIVINLLAPFPKTPCLKQSFSLLLYMSQGKYLLCALETPKDLPYFVPGNPQVGSALQPGV